MSGMNILVYAPDPVLLERMLHIIAEEQDWKAEGTTDDERAIEMFHRRKNDLVIIGGDVNSMTDTKLKKLFTRLDRHVSILNFYGGDDWYLTVQIRTIMKLDEDAPVVIDAPF
jgi:hypothetical protein